MRTDDDLNAELNALPADSPRRVEIEAEFARRRAIDLALTGEFENWLGLHKALLAER